MIAAAAALLIGHSVALGLATDCAVSQESAGAWRTEALPPLEWRLDRAVGLAAYAEPVRFGRRGSRRWQVFGGFAFQPPRVRNTHLQGGLGVSYFVVNNLSFDAELNALYISQRGDDALAGNVNLFFRWHFLSEEKWSLYADAGAGMLLASNRVPRDGSRFNFTPQIGAGMSFELASDVRLMTGFRWHHISNANLYSDNPGRDSILAYAGLSFGY